MADPSDDTSLGETTISYFLGPIYGALLTIWGAFPAAALVALIYRFPIPFGGYMSGFGAVIPSVFAVSMYGTVYSGFIILAVLGALGGAIAYSIGTTDRGKFQLTFAVSVMIDFLLAVFMAVLDKIIGAR